MTPEEIEKIEVKPNQYIWVDKSIQASVTLFYDKEPKTYSGNLVAASPGLNLDVPTYIEYLAEQMYPKIAVKVDNTLTIDSNALIRLGFIKGYQTAEKELFTEEEVRKAIELTKSSAFVKRIHNSYVPDELLDDVDFDSTEQIIGQLKQEKK